jgi:hypothetical protein
MKLILKSIAALMASLFIGAANATVINFDDLSGPVVLGEQYASLGVHFSAYENGSAVGALAGNSLSGTYHTPDNVWSNCVGSICGSRADVLRIDFDSAVSDLSWWTDTAGTFGGDMHFNAYGSDDSLLESIIATATVEGTYALSAFSVSGISYVELLQPTDDWGYYIDTLSFTASVPEPSVLFLMGAGLAGIGLARRRKQQA